MNILSKFLEIEMERVTRDYWFDQARKWYQNKIIFGNIYTLMKNNLVKFLQEFDYRQR